MGVFHHRLFVYVIQDRYYNVAYEYFYYKYDLEEKFSA